MPLCRFATMIVALLVSMSVSAEQGATTFAWVKQNVHFYDAARLGDETVRQQLETAMVRELERKGLKFVESTKGADLGLSYVAVLENAASAAEVAAFWNEYPEIEDLPDQPHKFERGMLFGKLEDLQSGATVWKSTYRALVALDMPDVPRQQRMHQIVVTFLASFTP